MVVSAKKKKEQKQSGSKCGAHAVQRAVLVSKITRLCTRSPCLLDTNKWCNEQSHPVLYFHDYQLVHAHRDPTQKLTNLF